MEIRQNDNIQQVGLLIKKFCKIILTDNDFLNHEQAEEYINNLTNNDICVLNSIKEDEDKEIRNIVLIHLINYLQSFQTAKISSPFQFDNKDNFFQYKKHFEHYYASKNNNAPIPYVFVVAFDYIQSTSDHYRIFEQFYNVRSAETNTTVLEAVKKASIEASQEAAQEAAQKAAETVYQNAKDAAQTAADLAVKKLKTDAEKVVRDASNEAQAYVKVASEAAESAMQKAQNAAKNAAAEATKIAIKNEMTNVTKSISESSVTILGIFSGIVLTVVAGLFYSSSVLESVVKTNFFKLMFISSLVGLVCFGLIVVMFRFIEKISGKTENKFFSDKIVISIMTILCAVMIGGLALYIIELNTNDETDEITTEASTCACFEEESTTE